jgi:hypothetical protein
VSRQAHAERCTAVRLASLGINIIGRPYRHSIDIFDKAMAGHRGDLANTCINW